MFLLPETSIKNYVAIATQQIENYVGLIANVCQIDRLSQDYGY